MYTAAKILIVDDHPAIHAILAKLFDGRGESGAKPVILNADNGQAALDILAGNPDIDVIILDLNMPVMDGFELLAHIKGDLRFQAIPVCVFSGNKDDSVKALKLGARDFINKPGDYFGIKIRVANLIESKRQAEASERAKINFLATVSHELRTPMNGVIGMTQLLQTTELTVEQSEYVETIEESADDMMAIINNVISFLGSEAPLHHMPIIPFSLRVIAHDSMSQFISRALENNVAVDVDIHPDIPDRLLGLPDQLQTIFYHLLNNAVTFSPSGTVCLRIMPGVHKESSVQLLCSIADTGIGISAEKQSSIFKPFTQADGSFTRKFGGLGIGLSIADRLVQMMGSSLAVESAPGCGSTFSFSVLCTLDPAW